MTAWVECPDCPAVALDVGPVGESGRAIVVQHSPTCPQLRERRREDRRALLDRLVKRVREHQTVRRPA